MTANPKQLYGDKKLPLHLVPPTAINYIAMSMAEGARKYGPYNYRETNVEVMTYIGATMRHLMAYLDGEYLDPESGNPHLSHAMASLAILADGHENDTLIDNRPKKGSSGRQFSEYAERKAAANPPAPVYAHTGYGADPFPTLPIVETIRFVNPMEVGLPLTWVDKEAFVTYDPDRNTWYGTKKEVNFGLNPGWFEKGYVTFV